MTVTVVTLRHFYDIESIKVFSTRDKAVEWLANYCLSKWDNDRGNPPKGNEALIDEFFMNHTTREEYDLNEYIVDDVEE